MSFRVVFTPGAKADLKRLYAFQLERDLALAEHALAALQKAMLLLQDFPFSCRKVGDDPWLRELIVPFGRSGYLVLFEISAGEVVTVLAARHQMESDYT